jgi:DNA-binding transcriptional MerR regulator
VWARGAVRVRDVTTLKRWSERGVLPEPVRLGPSSYRYYRADDIDALLKNMERAHD